MSTPEQGTLAGAPDSSSAATEPLVVRRGSAARFRPRVEPPREETVVISRGILGVRDRDKKAQTSRERRVAGDLPSWEPAARGARRTPPVERGMTVSTAGTSPYETWVLTLRAWSQDPMTPLDQLPALTDDTFTPETYGRLIDHLMKALQTASDRWQSHLERAWSDVSSPHGLSRQLVALRSTLSRRVQLSLIPRCHRQCGRCSSATSEQPWRATKRTSSAPYASSRPRLAWTTELSSACSRWSVRTPSSPCSITRSCSPASGLSARPCLRHPPPTPRPDDGPPPGECSPCHPRHDRNRPWLTT